MSAKKSEWIPVSERLPEKSGTYLICTKRGKVITMPFTAQYKRFNGSVGRECTHWMECPKGPEDK